MGEGARARAVKICAGSGLSDKMGAKRMESAMRDQVILVTGGTRGIGRAIAAEAASAGACVVVTSRRPAGKPTPGPGVTCIELDVTSEDSVRDAFAGVLKRHGRLDGLVNNAGVGVFKPIGELTLAEWERIVATDLTGAFLCCREAFRAMEPAGGGRIVNIGSVADYVPLPGNAAYGSAKAGLRALSAILNEEGKAKGIRVTHVSLGAVHTDIWEERPGFSAADMLPLEEVGRQIAQLLRLPLAVRIDEIKLLPPKGVL